MFYKGQTALNVAMFGCIRWTTIIQVLNNPMAKNGTTKTVSPITNIYSAKIIYVLKKLCKKVHSAVVQRKILFYSHKKVETKLKMVLAVNTEKICHNDTNIAVLFCFVRKKHSLHLKI